MDVRNTVECFDLSISMVNKLADAKADDGKISYLEIGQLLVSSVPEAYAAYKDIDQVAAEMKDLDVEELKVLAAKGIALQQAVSKLLLK